MQACEIIGYGQAEDVEEIQGVIPFALQEFHDGGNKHEYIYEWDDWFSDRAIFIVNDDAFIANNDGGIEMIDLSQEQLEALKQLLDGGGDVVEETTNEEEESNETLAVLPNFNPDDHWFNNGFDIVEIDDKYGVINEKGQLLVPAEYDDCDMLDLDYDNSCFCVKKDGKQGVLKSNGEVLIPIEYEDITDIQATVPTSFIVKKDNKYGLINGEGKVVVALEYDYMSKTENYGVLIIEVEKDGIYGAMNENGEIIVPIEYDSIEAKRVQDIAIALIVSKDGMMGALGADGSFILDLVYDNVRVESNNVKSVFITTKNFPRECTMYDMTGKMLLDPTGITGIEEYSEDLILVIKDRKTGFVDLDGNFVIQPIYSNAKEFGRAKGENGKIDLAPVEIDGKWGFINKEGKLVIPNKFDSADAFWRGTSSVTLNGQTGEVDADGNFTPEE